MSKKAAKAPAEESASVEEAVQHVGIKETGEAVDALASIAARAFANLGDGTLTWAEKVAFTAELPGVYRALSGCTQIPGELADLDDAEKDDLLQRISACLVAVGLGHRAADASNDILNWIYTTIRTFLKVKNAPPSAVAV